QLEKDLKKIGIKSFDYSQYKDHEIIGRGGCAVVYSAFFNNEKHALKSLNNNLSFDEKSLKRVKRENLSSETTVEFITNIIRKDNHKNSTLTDNRHENPHVTTS
ncbi:21918_t:CDS:2, partial [Racocetra persica]